MKFNSSDIRPDENINAESSFIGTAVASVEGSYTVLLDSSEKTEAVPRGVFRHDEPPCLSATG